MSKLKEQIIRSIDLQNQTFVDKDGATQSFEPKNAYLLLNENGTHERYVTDDNNVISLQKNVSSVTSQDYVTNSTLTSILSNYVTNTNLTVNYYTKTQSDTRYIIKATLAGTGNRLVQAQPDGTLVPITVGTLPPDKVLGYDALNNPTAFQAKAFKSTWVDSIPPTISELIIS